jgi:hypothetical protein
MNGPIPIMLIMFSAVAWTAPKRRVRVTRLAKLRHGARLVQGLTVAPALSPGRERIAGTRVAGHIPAQMCRLPVFVAAALLQTLALPRRAYAQVYVGLDATLTSPYVWRGITRANGWIAQPEGFLSVKAGGGFLSAGAWASYELGHAGPNDLSDLGPGHAGLAELDFWGQADWSLGLFQASLGGIRYTFRGTAPLAGRTRADNTTEMYVDVRATSKYIVPAVALWLDVDRVRGAYIEGSATVPLLANPLGEPFIGLITRATVGYQLGQEGAYFTRAGITHVDLAVSSDVTLHPVHVPTVLRVEGHVQFSTDDSTRPSSANPSDVRRSAKLWAALALRLSPRIVSW